MRENRCLKPVTIQYLPAVTSDMTLSAFDILYICYEILNEWINNYGTLPIVLSSIEVIGGGRVKGGGVKPAI